MSLNGTFIVGRDFATNTGNAGVHTYRIQFGYKFEYQAVFNPPKSDCIIERLKITRVPVLNVYLEQTNIKFTKHTINTNLYNFI